MQTGGSRLSALWGPGPCWAHAGAAVSGIAQLAHRCSGLGAADKHEAHTVCVAHALQTRHKLGQDHDF